MTRREKVAQLARKGATPGERQAAREALLRMDNKKGRSKPRVGKAKPNPPAQAADLIAMFLREMANAISPTSGGDR